MLFARLSGEPWCWTREQILECDRFYVFEVVFHPRDEHGHLLFAEDEAVRMSPSEQLQRLARGKGWPEYRVVQWVREVTGGNGHVERRGPPGR